MRRVVTGHTPAGKAIIASDTEVDNIDIGSMDFIQLWGADEMPTFPDDGSSRPWSTFFPPVDGFRFLIFTLAPQSVQQPANQTEEESRAEMEEKLPGLAEHLEKGDAGMHTTNTIDFEYVISGEVWLELDDGEEVHLRAGDTVVQNGTRHAWRNKSSKPCCMAVCLIGAQRK